MRSPFQLVAITALATVAVSLLGACSQMVPLEPAPDATNPDCAEIIVRLPEGIDEFAQRETNAQATGAWGDPAAIFLRCGVEVPGPSALPCFTVKGVDWLRDSSEAPVYKFISYGRDPAVEVVIDGDRASSSALSALGNAVGSLPVTKECLAAEDVFEENEE
ncbi:DUF3515 domain-containing protein [Homoserinimonas sp. A520]